jgi:uncharacterized membrane protein YqjE
MNSDYQSSGENDRGESIMDLMRGILHDARTLSSKEFTAAKLEIREEISNAVRSSIFLGVGLFMLATGIVVLSIVIALVLARYFALPIWASLGIVGGAYTILGLIIILVGKHKMKGITAIPQDTLRSTREDAHYIRQKAIGH